MPLHHDDHSERPTGPVSLPMEHPARVALSREVHARPFATIVPPARITHLAMLSGENGRDDDICHLETLCNDLGVRPPDPGATHFMQDLGGFHLKWERHTEFCGYTFIVPGPVGEDVFQRSALQAVPADWIRTLPGSLIAAINVAFVRADIGGGPETGDTVPTMLGTDNFAAGLVAGGKATAFMDFGVDDLGFCRVHIRDHGLSPRQAGRLVQRLIEIETYRILALMAFPIARANGPKLTALGERLHAITQRMTGVTARPGQSPHQDSDGQPPSEAELLAEITRISAENERISAETQYRFSAGEAYYDLVRRRIDELRERRIEGYQTFHEFMDRRMTPAMRTCAAVRLRNDDLAEKLARAGQLLRTRVEIEIEGQNRDLLRSMDRRARLQLRLQSAVEGLSVAAISYYLVSLIGYAARAVDASLTPLPVPLIMGLSVPFVALGVWSLGRAVRRRIERQSEDAGPSH